MCSEKTNIVDLVLKVENFTQQAEELERETNKYFFYQWQQKDIKGIELSQNTKLIEFTDDPTSLINKFNEDIIKTEIQYADQLYPELKKELDLSKHRVKEAAKLLKKLAK